MVLHIVTQYSSYNKNKNNKNISNKIRRGYMHSIQISCSLWKLCPRYFLLISHHLTSVLSLSCQILAARYVNICCSRNSSKNDNRINNISLGWVHLIWWSSFWDYFLLHYFAVISHHLTFVIFLSYLLLAMRYFLLWQIFYMEFKCFFQSEAPVIITKVMSG